MLLQDYLVADHLSHSYHSDNAHLHAHINLREYSALLLVWSLPDVWGSSHHHWTCNKQEKEIITMRRNRTLLNLYIFTPFAKGDLSRLDYK